MAALSAVTKAKVMAWLEEEIEVGTKIVENLKEIDQPGAAELLQQEIDAELIVLNKLQESA